MNLCPVRRAELDGFELLCCDEWKTDQIGQTLLSQIQTSGIFSDHLNSANIFRCEPALYSSQGAKNCAFNYD